VAHLTGHVSVPQIQEAPASTTYYLFYLDCSSLKSHGFSEGKGRDFGDGCIRDKLSSEVTCFQYQNPDGIPNDKAPDTHMEP